MHTRQQKRIDRFKDQDFDLKSYANHIAYLFDGSKCVAISTNSWGKHAEMGVLPYVESKRSQTLYVRRVNSINPMSRPCVRCSKSLLKVSQRLRVFYTDNTGHWQEDKMLDTEHRSKNDHGQATSTLRLRSQSSKRKQRKNIS